MSVCECVCERAGAVITRRPRGIDFRAGARQWRVAARHRSGPSGRGPSFLSIPRAAGRLFIRRRVALCASGPASLMRRTRDRSPAFDRRAPPTFHSTGRARTHAGTSSRRPRGDPADRIDDGPRGRTKGRERGESAPDARGAMTGVPGSEARSPRINRDTQVTRCHGDGRAPEECRAPGKTHTRG